MTTQAEEVDALAEAFERGDDYTHDAITAALREYAALLRAREAGVTRDSEDLMVARFRDAFHSAPGYLEVEKIRKGLRAVLPLPSDAQAKPVAWEITDKNGKVATIYNKDLADALRGIGASIRPFCESSALEVQNTTARVQRGQITPIQYQPRRSQ